MGHAAAPAAAVWSFSPPPRASGDHTAPPSSLPHLEQVVDINVAQQLYPYRPAPAVCLVEELRVVLAHHRQLRELLLHQLIQPLLLAPSSHSLSAAVHMIHSAWWY